MTTHDFSSGRPVTTTCAPDFQLYRSKTTTAGETVAAAPSERDGVRDARAADRRAREVGDEVDAAARLGRRERRERREAERDLAVRVARVGRVDVAVRQPLRDDGLAALVPEDLGAASRRSACSRARSRRHGSRRRRRPSCPRGRRRAPGARPPRSRASSRAPTGTARPPRSGPRSRSRTGTGPSPSCSSLACRRAARAARRCRPPRSCSCSSRPRARA